MKALVLYATKHGAALEAARKIAAQFSGAKLVDLNDIKTISKLNLATYDCIILGSSVYAGQTRPALKHFSTNNQDELMDADKRLGIFLVGMDADKEDVAFGINFEDSLLEAAKAKAFVGGIYDPKKANFAERLIMKALKFTEYTNTIDDEKIAEFVQALKMGD